MRNVNRGLSVLVLSTSLVSLAATAGAQDSPDTSKAAIGQEVHVTALDGTRLKGQLLDMSAKEITIDTGGSKHTFNLENVAEVRRGSHAVLYGVLIGLATGIGFSQAELNCDCDYGPEVLLWPGIGAGIGAAVGAAIRATTASSRLVYQHPAKRPVTFMPVIEKGRVGVSASIGW